MKIISRSAEETVKIGRQLSRYMAQGHIILLSGNLGSGKTILAKGIAAGLGINKKNIISPTFVIMRAHQGKKLDLYHFDFYRIDKPEQITSLGYEEYFYNDALTLIEWPERLKYLLPSEFLAINLSVVNAKSRRLDFSAKGKIYKDILKAFRFRYSETEPL